MGQRQMCAAREVISSKALLGRGAEDVVAPEGHQAFGFVARQRGIHRTKRRGLLAFSSFAGKNRGNSIPYYQDEALDRNALPAQPLRDLRQSPSEGIPGAALVEPEDVIGAVGFGSDGCTWNPWPDGTPSVGGVRCVLAGIDVLTPGMLETKPLRPGTVLTIGMPGTVKVPGTGPGIVPGMAVIAAGVAACMPGATPGTEVDAPGMDGVPGKDAVPGPAPGTPREPGAGVVTPGPRPLPPGTAVEAAGPAPCPDGALGATAGPPKGAAHAGTARAASTTEMRRERRKLFMTQYTPLRKARLPRMENFQSRQGRSRGPPLRRTRFSPRLENCGAARRKAASPAATLQPWFAYG